MVVPAGSVSPTLQPFTPAAPAVTRTVATKPPVHALTEAVAEHAPPGGGVVGGGVVGGGVGVVPLRVGADQSTQSARRPWARLEMRVTPGSLPVLSRCLRMFCCSG